MRPGETCRPNARGLSACSLARFRACVTGPCLVDAVIDKTGTDLIDEEPSPVREDRLQNLKELALAANDSRSGKASGCESSRTGRSFSGCRPRSVRRPVL